MIRVIYLNANQQQLALNGWLGGGNLISSAPHQPLSSQPLPQTNTASPRPTATGSRQAPARPGVPVASEVLSACRLAQTGERTHWILPGLRALSWQWKWWRRCRVHDPGVYHVFWGGY
ncbi:hypothetical protein E2C01_019659 [Portunus trituberculatus]|uniref:Uncharacterized protein n=1 Tax=Portunus trituberculatus TaxID=210409 RepID=A0A5B7DYJ3_PORTR|nr:hypothetical protein [Portunus trituberculatus]